MNPKARQELFGVAALVAGLFLGLTLLPVGFTGPWGRALGAALWWALGLGAVFLPLLGVGWALAAFDRLGTLSTRRAAALGAGLMLLVPYAVGVATRMGHASPPSDHGQWTATQALVGLVPGFLVRTLHGAIGTAGATLAGLFALSALGMLTIGWHPLMLLRLRRAASGEREPAGPAAATGRSGKHRSPLLLPEATRLLVPRARKGRGAQITPPPVLPPPAGALIPPITLLTEPPAEEADAGLAQIDEMGRRLLATLDMFHVGGTIAGRTVGPVVTRYEIAPGRGVKVGRIASLADDLALAMEAKSLRIVAPIPGKAAVGIEVPNPTPRMVTIRELIGSDEWLRRSCVLPVGLGRNLEGDAVVDDLAKMPHLLIAGVTGSGKSVCINTIITSLLYAYPPERLRLLMIDPKMVELSMYGDLPHLGHPVVTNNHKAATVFKWAVKEMERRYRLLHANHARNLADFNRKVEDKKPLKGPRETLATQAGVQREIPFDAEYTGGILPYIVMIVDELADLMMTVQGEIETPLATLAQKARAIGIHLILATQRPSVNVITGLIKANFSCRIAFRVSAKVDSRTILDRNGAETLLGNGDMLFLPPGKSEPVRLQGAYIATEETERLMAWYRDHAPAAVDEQAKAKIAAEIVAIEEAEGEGGEGASDAGGGERDPLFRQAAEVCIQNQLGSTSLLQRRMSIGYGRAARIIDQLEETGILGPPNGSKPRDVLVGMEELEEICGPANRSGQ